MEGFEILRTKENESCEREVLNECAEEKGTFPISYDFEDVNGEFTPKTFLWSLTDLDGTEINSRTDVSIVPTSSTVIVVLKGDDLALTSGSSKRLVTIKATYDSVTFGNDCPLNRETEFGVRKLVNIT